MTQCSRCDKDNPAEIHTCTPKLHRESYLLGFVDGRESVNKWISVKDRLPDEYVDVLLLCKSKDETYTYVITGRRSPEMHPKVYGECPWSVKLFATNIYLCMESNKIYNSHDQNHFFYGDVTHWMPLPETPE